MLSQDYQRLMRWGISALVASMLVIQASFIPLKISGNSPHTWYWPFIDYPMYEFSHHEGEYVISDRTLEVVLADGTVEQISGDDIGLGFWNFLYLTGRMVKGDTTSVQQLIDVYDRGTEITRVRIYSPPIMLTREGAKEVEPKLLGELIIDEARRRSAGR